MADMSRTDFFDRIFGGDDENASRYRDAYSRRWPDDTTLFIGIADVLSVRTAWEFVPRDDMSRSKTDPREPLYTRAEVQTFIEAWATADFFRDIRWTLRTWHPEQQPIESIVEAIPVVYRMLTSGADVQQICVAWNEGKFWAMDAEGQGVHPELAGALG